MNKEVKVEAATSLHSAMALAFAEIEGATKDKSNPAFKSKYADLASVVDAIRPALAKHGLWFQQVTHDMEDRVCVETIIRHATGEYLSCGTLSVPVTKRDAQGFGSALTYCRRYALMTAFGVPAEDDDGNAAAKAAPPPPAREPLIADEDRDLIATLAEAAGKPLKAICDAYKVPSLKELTAKQGAAVIEKLRTMAAPKQEEVA
jgi:hypothetical protein